jgi:hypothetical protein
MNTLTRGIIAAGTGALLVSLAYPARADAAPGASTPGMPRHCYAWPSESLRLDEANEAGDAASGWHTDAVMVTDGSPCRDINVHKVARADGRGQCRDLRVRWTEWPAKAEAWHRVCSDWQVLAYGAAEGTAYTIESRNGGAVQVQVRG